MMKDTIHIFMATTFSMLLTLVFHCTLAQTRVYNSLLQQFVIDTLRDIFLVIPCWFADRHSPSLCSYLLIGPSLPKVHFIIIIGFLFLAVVLCYGLQVYDRLKPIILTILVPWLITRYFDNNNIYFKMDVLTVHFIVWQFIYLMSKWEGLELKYPLLILQQASCCISCSIMAFLFDDIAFVYFPFQFKIIFLWLYSLYDIVVCLHPYGPLRVMLVNWFSNPSPPGIYYTFDIDDAYNDQQNFKNEDFENDANAEESLSTDKCDNKSGLFLGLGDFIVFNQMVLFILLPAWSMATKILVAFGCIISIQLGQCGTSYMHRLWGVPGVPGLPLPVITFSMYAFVLNVIMQYTNNDC